MVILKLEIFFSIIVLKYFSDVLKLFGYPNSNLYKKGSIGGILETLTLRKLRNDYYLANIYHARVVQNLSRAEYKSKHHIIFKTAIATPIKDLAD